MNERAIGKQEAMKILTRLMSSGPLERIPKRANDARMLLALAASSLDSRARYSELELNALLKEWLDGFACPIGVDHVTVRRLMVDLGLLLRDAPGSFYETNETVTTSVLAPDARSIDLRTILKELEAERAKRKRTRAK